MKVTLWTDEHGPIPKPQSLRKAIRSALLNALAYTDGNHSQAARLLGLPRSTLLYQMRLHGIPGVGSQNRKDTSAS